MCAVPPLFPCITSRGQRCCRSETVACRPAGGRPAHSAPHCPLRPRELRDSPPDIHRDFIAAVLHEAQSSVPGWRPCPFRSSKKESVRLLCMRCQRPALRSEARAFKLGKSGSNRGRPVTRMEGGSRLGAPLQNGSTADESPNHHSDSKHKVQIHKIGFER